MILINIELKIKTFYLNHLILKIHPTIKFHPPKVVEGNSLEEQERKLNLLRYRMTLTALMIVKSLLVVMTHLSKIPP